MRHFNIYGGSGRLDGEETSYRIEFFGQSGFIKCKYSIYSSECKRLVLPQTKDLVMYLLHIDLNVFLQAVAVQVQHQIVDKIKAVTHNDQRQLVSQLCLL